MEQFCLCGWSLVDCGGGTEPNLETFTSSTRHWLGSSRYEQFSIEITKNYSVSDWHDDARVSEKKLQIMPA